LQFENLFFLSQITMSSSSTVVRTDLNALEDRQLLQTFTVVSNLYWCFNAFTQVCQTADCGVHIYILLQSIVRGDSLWLCCASLCLNTISVIVKWRVFGFANPFYFLVNHFPSKYSVRSRFRLIQLWHRYHDIVDNFFHKLRRSTNATKNFGYLNVKILAVVFIEDFGSPKLPCPGFAVHELYESLPFLVCLLSYIALFGVVDNALCTLSILLSLTCILCQVFNFLAALDNIHYSILGARFWCIAIDVVGSVAMIGCATVLLYGAEHDGLQWLRNIWLLKFVCTTLPLSFGLSWLFVLRSIGMSYNPHHRPNAFTFALHLIFTAFLIAVITLLSSMALEMATFHWCGLLINRLCNERFSYFDGNNNFWRRIIEWMLTDFASHVRRKHCSDLALQQRLLYGLNTKERVLRLFSVNTILSRYHSFERFHDVALQRWTSDVYKHVFYTYFGDAYEINVGDFKRHSQSAALHGYQSLFAMMIHEQIAIYFSGSNQSTANDMVQYLADSLWSFNVTPNLWRRQSIDWLCQRIFDLILYYTLWIASPLYLLCRALNVCVPAIVLWCSCTSLATPWHFPWIIALCYYASIACFVLAWNVGLHCAGCSIHCGRDVSQLIASLCPSLQRPRELYVSLKHGYFTQHELFERILWYYERHRYAQIEGEIVIDRFGPDIAREIFEFLPMSYAEEKISVSN